MYYVMKSMLRLDIRGIGLNNKLHYMHNELFGSEKGLNIDRDFLIVLITKL